MTFVGVGGPIEGLKGVMYLFRLNSANHAHVEYALFEVRDCDLQVLETEPVSSDLRQVDQDSPFTEFL